MHAFRENIKALDIKICNLEVTNNKSSLLPIGKISQQTKVSSNVYKEKEEVTLLSPMSYTML
uniref:Uncharacterized protein n=1 Tax=Rhizophora mucronata TaxID=61149 RepID=A0A2P2NTZ5_RHIMU